MTSRPLKRAPVMKQYFAGCVKPVLPPITSYFLASSAWFVLPYGILGLPPLPTTSS